MTTESLGPIKSGSAFEWMAERPRLPWRLAGALLSLLTFGAALAALIWTAGLLAN